MVMGQIRQEAEIVVVGGGPGGYVAALRAADLGKEVVLVDERPALGGVCLHEGCIPSKALIHAVETVHAARDGAAFGLDFDGLRIDLDRLRAFKEGRGDPSVLGDRRPPRPKGRGANPGEGPASNRRRSSPSPEPRSRRWSSATPSWPRAPDPFPFPRPEIFPSGDRRRPWH